jgi:hypothetical protein
MTDPFARLPEKRRIGVLFLALNLTLAVMLLAFALR